MPRILLVEDEELNRDMLRRRLLKRGYEVEVALDAAECFDKVAANRPDLILMDVQLRPEGREVGPDGWEATRYLKGRAESRSIPVIALTSFAMAEDRDRSRDAGCDDYESKPVNLESLLKKIEALLAGKATP
jgi:CheY-like chemotaxis protein